MNGMSQASRRCSSRCRSFDGAGRPPSGRIPSRENGLPGLTFSAALHAEQRGIRWGRDWVICHTHSLAGATVIAPVRLAERPEQEPGCGNERVDRQTVTAHLFIVHGDLTTIAC